MNNCPDKEIKVELYRDNTYRVIEKSYAHQIGSMMCETFEDILFQGYLADCEAFIRLREKGQI
jgi:hypothetical protein